jgi:hypothetical protein
MTQGLASMYYTPQQGNVRKLGSGIGLYSTHGVDADQFNNQVQTVDTTPTVELPKSTAINYDFGNNGADKGWMAKVADWFTPQGDKGTSVGGNIINAVGTGVQGASGLAGIYFAHKNAEALEEQQKRENKIQDKALARVDNMQKNYDTSTRVVG